MVEANKETVLFRRTVLDYYAKHGRHDLPWRTPAADGSFNPYNILVSEIMLQQTQVPRVIPKFNEFVTALPDTAALAAAPLGQVLRMWSGLGYNRRAKFLWQAAQAIVAEHDSQVPAQRQALERLPGIGPSTAGAILAYAYNQPVVFIETNIRTVFIHHFFADGEKVPDKDIIDLVARTLPDNPRAWYWALMDYGSHLKRTVGNVSRSSSAYARQSPFHGSRRQVRGQVLLRLGAGPLSVKDLQAAINDPRVSAVVDGLAREGLITLAGGWYRLPD